MQTPRNRGGLALVRRAVATLALACSGMALAPTAHAAAPAAGAVIGNQASATYTDASLVSRIATSNTVQTVVQQVSSFTLVADQSKMAAPGQTVYFPHTLTNTGNGTDSYTLSAADVAGGFNFSDLKIYADANGDGVPDNATAITSTGALAAGGVFKFVVAGSVPGSATNGSTDQVLVTATDATPAGGTPTASNTDTVTITGNAVISVTKTLSQSSGPSPSAAPITVTLTYTNTGNTTATAVTITDVIGTGATAGMTYKAGSAKWNGVALTDAAAGDPAGSSFDWNVTTANTATAVIGSVAPNVTGTLTFEIEVASNVAPGTAITSNTAKFSYDPDGPGATAPTTPVDTNTATYLVLQAAAVAANDVGSTTDTPDADDDIVKAAAVPQGSVVVFDNVIHNNGNGADRFNITVAPGTFPAGTTFLLFKSDGVTPLVDTNGDGTPDTGLIAPGGNYHVFVKAVLPASATSATPVTATLTATSVFDPTTSDPVANELAAITGSTVDLRNGVANVDGTGAGPEVNPVTTQSVNPGASTTFVLRVNNTSAVADSYNLTASTDSTFAALTLPTDWTVVFRSDGGAGTCATTGPVITNTGVINAGADKTICAVVTVPADAAAAPAPGQSLYFRVLSPTTGALDRKHEAVIVNTVRGISILPNNAGQVFPGGTVVYSHTLANTGNVAETAATVAIADSLAGWSSVVYWDENNDGALDASDPVLTNISQITGGLSHKESARIFVKVFAPAAAGIGDIDLSTVTVTVTGGAIHGVAVPPAASAQDTTSVIAGQVRLVKDQVLDADCDGAETAYSQAQITTGAVPGACIKYRITAINEGTAEVTTLLLSDASPAATTIESSVAACAATVSTGTVTAPADGTAGTVQANFGTLAPSAQATLTFCVKIDE